MRRPDAVHVVGVHVLVERALDQVLRLVTRERPHLLVEEDELEVEAGAEHEDVAEHLDLGDGARRQRVRHGHQTYVLQDLLISITLGFKGTRNHTLLCGYECTRHLMVTG